MGILPRMEVGEEGGATLGESAWAPASPKLSVAGRSSWYKYYAGYSRPFVTDTLVHLGLAKGSTILDPWNGSGTTTAVAAEAGHDVIGFDANPALVLVARGRLLGRDIAPSIDALMKDVLGHAKKPEGQPEVGGVEPLERWFDKDTATRLRCLEVAVQRSLVDHDRYQAVESRGLEDVSRLAALFYVALFEVVRSLISPFRTTNPTWLKTATKGDTRMSADWSTLESSFQASVVRLGKAVAGRPEEAETGVTLDLANSTDLPLKDDTIDATITSPPYLTRIDYVIATLPELAVLGYADSAVKTLRDSMIGTPTVVKSQPQPIDAWGDSARRLLETVKAHPSRASETYYLKYFTQYLAAMWTSIGQLRRVTKAGAPLVVVAQDSYYKEVHVDLPRILSEMIRGSGWSDVAQVNFPARSTKAAINAGAKKYRTSFDAVESVLVCS